MLKGLSIIAICTSLLISGSTLAKPEKVPMETVCDDFTAMIDILKNVDEEPLFMGKDDLYSSDTIFTAVYHNSKTGSYTVLLVEKQSKKACVVSSGTMGKLVLPKI